MSQSGTLPEQAVNIEIKPKTTSFLEIYIIFMTPPHHQVLILELNRADHSALMNSMQ